MRWSQSLFGNNRIDHATFYPRASCNSPTSRNLQHARDRGFADDTRIGLKTGATLVRQWRGHTHTVLVREDGFEYDGQRYRSLTVIAEKITGAHWSGPRFFGVSKRARAS